LIRKVSDIKDYSFFYFCYWDYLVEYLTRKKMKSAAFMAFYPNSMAIIALAN